MFKLFIFFLIFFLCLLLFIVTYQKIKIKLSILEKENEILKTKLFLLKNKLNKYKKIFPILNNEDYSYFKKNDYFQNRGDLGELIVKNQLEYLVKKMI